MPNTREKLIELLQDSVYENVELDDGYVGFDINYDNIANYLIANGVMVQKWIPVTERLPEKGTGKVLIVKQYRGKPYIDVGEVINGEACCYADEYAIDPKEHKFTHWMPLPEAPKGE